MNPYTANTKNDSVLYFSPQQKKALNHFKHLLSQYKKNIYANHLTPVFLCIGSDRATGDCYGPLVGDALSKHLNSCPVSRTHARVYGTLNSPVHALNLQNNIEEIYKTNKNPYIIAIDASLGISSHVGYITLSKGPLFPGIGVRKSLPQIGDLAITGIVNHSCDNCRGTLQSTKLSVVMNLANFTSEGIIQAFTNE